jgi:hypothetical protein
VGDAPGPSPKIKVVDRRRFTEDGVPRPDRPRADVAAPNADAAVDQAPPPRAGDGSEGREAPAATSREFVELVLMLGQQAELMLTGGEGFEPHPDEARRLIDALGAVEAKTRGNLSPKESRILGDVLYQLRSRFVQGPR